MGQATPRFLLEAKRAGKRLNQQDKRQALEYGRSLPVPFVVVTNGQDIQCFNTSNREAIRWNGNLLPRIPSKTQLPTVLRLLHAAKDATNLPLDADTILPFRPGLPVKQLNTLFARCHNAIRNIEKDEGHAFGNFSKLLFLKLLEEKAESPDFVLPYSYRFYELAEQPEAQSDQVKIAVLHMLDEIRNHTPFGDVLEERLYLTRPQTFRRIVKELAAVSFQDCNLDSKGAAFEYFVRATLKGKRLGQYFTPRPLVQLMSHLVGNEKILSSLAAGSEVKVLDPACGTGGFLVFLMQENLRILEQRDQLTAAARALLKEKLMQCVFFGADASISVAGAAKMNMIIAGDGHSNIAAADSLNSGAPHWKVSQPDCNLILTNPPFGMSEAETLTEQSRGDYDIQTTKGQHLFLQKMVRCTVAGGEICTVIDEGVLNTDTATGLRRFLLQKCRVLTVIRLPAETFKPNKINVKASVLYLRRREHDDLDGDDDYPITFCDVKSLGYAGSGDSVRGFDFPQLLSEVASRVNDHGSEGRRNGYAWEPFDVQSTAIWNDHSHRLDLKYWEPTLRQRIEVVRAAGGKTLELLNTIETQRGSSPKADLYVDQADSYAMVVKAGSSISRYGELDTEGADYIEKNVYEDQPAKSNIQEGDILLASTGDGTLGKCCVSHQLLLAVADGHVTILRVDPAVIDPDYLADYLRIGFGRDQIERLFTGSNGLVELTPKHVKSVVVDLLSSVEEQRERSRTLRLAEASYPQAVTGAESRHEAAISAFSSDQAVNQGITT